MRLVLPLAACALVTGTALFAVWNRQAAAPAGVEVLHLSSQRSLVWREPRTSVGLCPWRAPEEDRRLFFPSSNSSRDETLILSRLRIELKERLGRMPGADDNAIIVHRILASSGSPGIVVTRRVRGECGLIELVLAADNHGCVLGAKVQRHREPATTAHALFSEKWLDSFRGKDSRSAWQVGRDIPAVPADARVSADAIVHEARTALILLDVALRSEGTLPPRDAPTGKGHG